MPSYVLSDGTNVVSLNPEYDIKLGGQKIETSHRTRSGANYKYKWGQFDRVELTASFLSSSDMTKVNSWWGGNAPLMLYDMSSAVVISAYIAGDIKPIAQLVPPYTDQFMGVIVLEGY